MDEVAGCDFVYQNESHVSQSELTPLSVDHVERLEDEDKETGETVQEVKGQKMESGSPQIHTDKDTLVSGEPSHSAKTGHAPPKPGSWISARNWEYTVMILHVVEALFILPSKLITVPSYSLCAHQLMESECTCGRCCVLLVFLVFPESWIGFCCVTCF